MTTNPINLTHTSSGWVSGFITTPQCPTATTYKFSAKIYDDPSAYGIGDGRLSKLTLWVGYEEVYNYDRGLDFSNISEGHLGWIVETLENAV